MLVSFTFLKKKSFIALVIAALGYSNSVLAASVPPTSNEVLRLLKARYETDGWLCLGMKTWPVVAWPGDFMGPGEALPEMEKLGLVSSTAAPDAGKGKRRYTLTSEGATYLRNPKSNVVANSDAQKDICVGRVVPERITQTKGPFSFGGMPEEMQVYFVYSIQNEAAWFSNPKVLSAFLVLGNIKKGAGKNELNKTLIHEAGGWRVK